MLLERCAKPADTKITLFCANNGSVVWGTVQQKSCAKQKNTTENIRQISLKHATNTQQKNSWPLCATPNFPIRMTPFPGDYEGPVVAIEDMSAFTAHLMDGTREASRKGFINKDSI
jgi:hypothetical protein